MKLRLIYFLLAALSLGAPAFANDTSFTFIGGVPRIQIEKQIAMQSEKLEFRYVPAPPTPQPVNNTCPKGYYFADDASCYGGPEAYWQADHSYTFVNRGPARTLTIGLPFDMPECGTEMGYHGPCLSEGVSGLTTSIDGVPAKVSTHNLKMTQPFAINRVYSVLVPFKQGQTRVLRHRYHTLAISSVEGERFMYLLRTGSTWAGPIGRVDIAFELPPQHGPCVTANLPHTYDGHWLKVGLDNWKPDRDLDIVFVNRERALLGSGVAPWRDDFRDICQDAMDLPAAERSQLADKIELLYGAPGTTDGRFAKALSSGPMEFCRSSYYIQGIAQKEARFMPHVGLNLRYLPDPTYPGNMSQALKLCLVQLREPD